MSQTIAARLFNAQYAEGELEEALDGVPYERLSWDYYDGSLELYGLPPEWRMSEAVQYVIHSAGFRRAFCNHTDKWETHYSLGREDAFEPSKGWRVSYPSKRNDGDSAILVEEIPPTWGKDWFDTGKARVVTP